MAVGGVSEACLQLARIVLRLRDTFGQSLIPCLGLHHRQFGIAINQHIVGDQRLAVMAQALDPARCDEIFTQDAAALNHTPARRLQRGINVFGSGFGFVHGSQLSCKRLVQEGFLQRLQRGEFLLVDGFEAADFIRQLVELPCNLSLLVQRRYRN